MRQYCYSLEEIERVVAGNGSESCEPLLRFWTMTRKVSSRVEFLARGGDLLAPVAPACGARVSWLSAPL